MEEDGQPGEEGMLGWPAGRREKNTPWNEPLDISPFSSFPPRGLSPQTGDSTRLAGPEKGIPLDFLRFQGEEEKKRYEEMARPSFPLRMLLPLNGIVSPGKPENYSK